MTGHVDTVPVQPRPIDSLPGARRIAAEPFADWIAVAGTSAWISGIDAGIVEFDARSGERRRLVEIPGEICSAMDVGFGAVWAASERGAMLWRVHIETGEKVHAQTGAAPICESSVAAGEGGVWAISGPDNPGLIRFDPDLRQPPKFVAVDQGVVTVRAGLGAVWLANHDSGALYEVAPETMAVRRVIALRPGIRFLTIGADAVWVLNQVAGTVTRVRPGGVGADLEVVVSDGTNPGGEIAVGGGYVWARVYDQLIVQLDPGTGDIVARFGPASGSGGVAATDQALWVTAHDINTVWWVPLQGVSGR